MQKKNNNNRKKKTKQLFDNHTLLFFSSFYLLLLIFFLFNLANDSCEWLDDFRIYCLLEWKNLIDKTNNLRKIGVN